MMWSPILIGRAVLLLPVPIAATMPSLRSSFAELGIYIPPAVLLCWMIGVISTRSPIGSMFMLFLEKILFLMIVEM